MNDKGFGRYLADEHKAKGFQQLAAERRERIRVAAQAGTLTFDANGQPVDPLVAGETPAPAQPAATSAPPSTAKRTAEGARAGERGNESGFGKYIGGDAPAENNAAAREASAPTAGRGFGRYLN